MLFLISCSPRRQTVPAESFKVLTVNKTTPVKDQGSSSLCWIYAMLATIESDCLMRGDSVNLSPDFVARHLLEDRAEASYISQGALSLNTLGVAPMLLQLLDKHGIVPYDSYMAEGCNYGVTERRLSRLVSSAAARRIGINALRRQASALLDDAIRPLPLHIWMYRMEYTPRQMANSVCLTDEYAAMTSFTHEPFYQDIVLDVPDNRTGCRFLNLPLDSLLSSVKTALRQGRSVCWEGDISEAGFSFAAGTARLPVHSGDVTQQQRQREFETFRTTDDHCMEIIGMATDKAGTPHFICKNSWGKGNPYGGMMFMSEDYFKMKTIAVVMKAK